MSEIWKKLLNLNKFNISWAYYGEGNAENSKRTGKYHLNLSKLVRTFNDSQPGQDQNIRQNCEISAIV